MAITSAMQTTAADLAAKIAARGHRASAMRDCASYGTISVDDRLSGACIGTIDVYPSGRCAVYPTAGVRIV